ncbi:MAG: 3-dehydroquinate synthase [Muribaculaceae bacterium]|nr:3-dehydroquinate synthase [Muribaculaceae bacterium]
MSQKIIFTNDVNQAIEKTLDGVDYNKLFVLTDINTAHFVMPKFKDTLSKNGVIDITIKSGDVNKNLESLSHVWKQLGENGATRRSVLINLGGGMVTDLGGFAASTFKRGIRFINIPTTLLSAVDAAVGGKTGINFNGLKNEVGVFNEADTVIISTLPLDTLPIEEVKSGYAEMLKHGLLSSPEVFNKLLEYDFQDYNPELLLDLLEESVNVKREIVRQDPHENGLRRALNLGHTAGHAFESLAMKRMSPIPHGYAVAWGMIVELVLSHMILKFDSSVLHRYADYVYRNYGAFNITCEDYPELLSLMRHDKKINSGEINFSLLGSIGDVKINCITDEDDVKAALDIYRDLVHI